jgi:hypothetical protein
VTARTPPQVGSIRRRGQHGGALQARSAARYLADRMAEPKQNLIEAINKLSGKKQNIHKRITTLGSDLSKVQSQVDLSMRSIQALQKKHVLLLQTISPGISGASGSSNGVIGKAPATSSSPVLPGPHLHQGSTRARIPSVPPVQLGGVHHRATDQESRRHWRPKMDFPRFDGSNVCIWPNKCAAYFLLYSIPHDFSVTATSLHIVDRASHLF